MWLFFISRLRLLFTVSLLLLLTACEKEPEEKTVSSEPKGPISLVYVEWASEIASTHVMKALLTSVGYNVSIKPVTADEMWKSVGSGTADAMVAAWLPSTHAHYLEQNRAGINDFGPNLTGTRIGLVVPSSLPINSITELNSMVTELEGKIIGIDPGAGLMKKTRLALKEYQLNFELMEGSGTTMTQALTEAINNSKPIVVTGWTPHWKFAKFDLKYLADPKGIYGKQEFIHTIARKGLQTDKPQAAAILNAFEWTPADIAQVMVWINSGMTPEKSAERWLSANKEKVAKWLPKN
ncbi:glycine betaine ABC transporter substrate-binding protein [Spartinivicinus poritis]|uniref:Glycine betaine ABC transporter substrate-binding protein n=1 Tax=Spartinivicinus poritis TaxID=2994640 RepID=A0ABT5U544_9GAMM|nr:glycine betaine ABC transporter substrate-binding protein [Spartinivicinus sp. A2-2]MDE1461479.1 glycine betaine ABC transporter substrate-binding protein [Spartinivicinus sp. A2-2]